MIEKLDIKNYENKQQLVWFGVINKLNELVDAVNKLQKDYDNVCVWVGEQKLKEPAENMPEDNGYIKLDNDSLQKFLKAHPEYNNNGVIEIPKKEITDPYAEQRKWIGKLCKFWDDDAFMTSNDWAFGILTSIDKGMQFQYCCNENCNFKHCEPVKPDDDIIYKGGNNE